MSFTAFVDTCVLVPIISADLLLRCAEKRMFKIQWSDKVLEELYNVLTGDKISISKEKAEKRINSMKYAFNDSEIRNWQSLKSDFDDLPDPNDKHIAAAALLGGADVIVTHNLKHFPIEVLNRHQLFAQTPDEFMLDLWDLKPNYKKEIFNCIEQAAKAQSLEWRTFVLRLQKNGYPKLTKQILEWHFTEFM